MTEPLATIERLVNATNEHDLDVLAMCFADDYVNDTPAHPARGFRGRAQVRRNWEQIFASVPDLSARVVRHAVSDSEVWAELEMAGTRRDGSAHRMCGVVVFGVTNELIHWARFYLEPLDLGETTVDDAVRQQVVRR